jgi:hypothetical protein
MVDQPPTTTTRLNKRGLVVFGILGLIIVASLIGGWAYLTFSRQNMVGLRGTWRDVNNPKHYYEFRPNGDLETWSGSKEHWGRVEWSATWRREGNRIIIRTDRNWDFEGHLDGETIRGKTLIRDETGLVVNTADSVWQKE